MKEQEDKRKPVARKKIIGLPTTMNNGHSDFVGSVIGVVCVCMCVIFFLKITVLSILLLFLFQK